MGNRYWINEYIRLGRKLRALIEEINTLKTFIRIGRRRTETSLIHLSTVNQLKIKLLGKQYHLKELTFERSQARKNAQSESKK